MTKIFAVNPDLKLFKDYDVSKLENASKCDELSKKCGYAMTATKILAIALLVLSVVSVYFTVLGVSSLITGTSTIALLGIVSATVVSAIPTYLFLRASLALITAFQNRCKALIQLSQQHKVDLIKAAN